MDKKIKTTEANKHKLAIELMEEMSDKLKIKFEIQYFTAKNNVVLASRRWKVKVMGKAFYNTDFCKAVADAFVLVCKANDIKLEDIIKK